VHGVKGESHSAGNLRFRAAALQFLEHLPLACGEFTLLLLNVFSESPSSSKLERSNKSAIK